MAVLQSWDTAGYPAVSLECSQTRKTQGTLRDVPFFTFILSSGQWHSDLSTSILVVMYFLRVQPGKGFEWVSLACAAHGEHHQKQGTACRTEGSDRPLGHSINFALQAGPVLSSLTPWGQAPCQNRQHQFISQG